MTGLEEERDCLAREALADVDAGRVIESRKPPSAASLWQNARLRQNRVAVQPR